MSLKSIEITKLNAFDEWNKIHALFTLATSRFINEQCLVCRSHVMQGWIMKFCKSGRCVCGRRGGGGERKGGTPRIVFTPPKTFKKKKGSNLYILREVF